MLRQALFDPRLLESTYFHQPILKQEIPLEHL